MLSGYQSQKTYAFMQHSSLVTSRTLRALLLGYRTEPGGTRARHQVPGWSYPLGVGDLARPHKSSQGAFRGLHSCLRARATRWAAGCELQVALWAMDKLGARSQSLLSPARPGRPGPPPARLGPPPGPPPGPAPARPAQLRTASTRTALPRGLSGAALRALELGTAQAAGPRPNLAAGRAPG